MKDNVTVVKVPKEDSINVPYIKCDECNKNLDEKQPIQYCPECKENLCDRCDNLHDSKKPDHKTALVKYLRPKDETKCNKSRND